MSDLLNIDRTRERDLLPRETLRAHPVLRIPQVTRRDRRVMADLLADNPRLVPFITDLAHEEFAQESVQRLLDAVLGVAAGVLLAAQRRQEPLQDCQTPLRGVLFVRWRYEEVGVFDPVAREFGRGFVR